LAHRHHLTLKVQVTREAAEVPSVSGVWAVANYFEREVWDLLGVNFTAHPNLKRIMTPDDWIGHPLRKDYAYPQAYNGIAHLRDGQRFEPPPTPKPAAQPPASSPQPPAGGAVR
jgi:NADH:ubiquinone oxidoreductase subunit C